MIPEIGKIDRASFERVVFPRLGAPDGSILIGPKHGVDAAVIELSDGDVMVIAEDPTFGMPVIMPYFGWAIVHICASDVAVLGVRPKYMTICLMLPPGTREETFEKVWADIHQECQKLGISIVGGHTGVYPGIGYPLNGGCTVIGFGRKGQITPASNAQVGDTLIMTKGPAIEATALLAEQAEASLRDKLPPALVDRARSYIFKMTVVEDALIAAPDAHAMHDATEGGLINGVYEIAEASGTGVILYEDRIVIPDEVRAVCDHFEIDPLTAISEGTLVLTAPPLKAGRILDNLEKRGIPAWEIGEVSSGERIFVRNNGSSEELAPVKVDPFWAAYFSACES
ncbi:MAG: AIR synthase family protein [Dehalococcoidia bacterium]|nr:AIR synthase family protein [Dehalococcoidia bacterium]